MRNFFFRFLNRLKKIFLWHQAVHMTYLNTDRQVCVIKTVAYRARAHTHSTRTDKISNTEGLKILSNYIFCFKTVIIDGPTKSIHYIYSRTPLYSTSNVVLEYQYFIKSFWNIFFTDLLPFSIFSVNLKSDCSKTRGSRNLKKLNINQQMEDKNSH